MKSFEEALTDGNFIQDEQGSYIHAWKDGDDTYEFWFEKLLWDNQYYVAIYKNGDLVTEKIVVKPGK